MDWILSIQTNVTLQSNNLFTLYPPDGLSLALLFNSLMHFLTSYSLPPNTGRVQHPKIPEKNMVCITGVYTNRDMANSIKYPYIYRKSALSLPNPNEVSTSWSPSPDSYALTTTTKLVAASVNITIETTIFHPATRQHFFFVHGQAIMCHNVMSNKVCAAAPTVHKSAIPCEMSIVSAWLEFNVCTISPPREIENTGSLLSPALPHK